MKILAPLLIFFSLVCLTSPDGFAVWVQKDQIVSIIRPADGECKPPSKSRVVTSQGAYCVQEERKDIVNKVDQK